MMIPEQLGDFDLFTELVDMPGFTARESGAVFEVDVDGGRVTYSISEPAQLQLNAVASHWTENDLVRPATGSAGTALLAGGPA